MSDVGRLPISISAFTKEDTIPTIWNRDTGQVACPLWCPAIQHAFTAQDSWVTSSHGYGEAKKSPYPTFTVSLSASLQPSPQYVPYLNIIQSCELASQGQASPSFQILK